MNSYFELLRPKQWIQNIFVIAPVVFSFSFLDPQKVMLAFAAFFVFSSASSSVYILNDILDAPLDCLHPLKRLRPIARGAVSPTIAALIGAGLTMFSLGLGYFISYGFFAAILAYL